MNSRARLFGGLLALILLACLVVIFLDQRGAFGGGTSVAPTPSYDTPSLPPSSTPAPVPDPAPTPDPTPTPDPEPTPDTAPTDSSDYGDL